MKTTHFFLFILVLCSIISCGNDHKKSTDPEVEVVEVSEKKDRHTSAALEAEFKEPKMAAIYAGYNQLKTSLVNSNSETTAEAASELLKAYADMGIEGAVYKSVEAIVSSDDIENQRKAFVDVTADMEEMLQGALSSGAIYKQYCPMAFNNTGAFWLSNTKEIRNPYFGDMMLKCGRVDSEIE